MGELPEKFPEYPITYRTITNQIKTLEEQKENSSKEEIRKTRTLKSKNIKN